MSEEQRKMQVSAEVRGDRCVMQRGDTVRTLFDTGAMGCAILEGEVIAAGPKAYRVRWVSGLTNRIAQGDWRVTRAALAKVPT